MLIMWCSINPSESELKQQKHMIKIYCNGTQTKQFHVSILGSLKEKKKKKTLLEHNKHDT
jgi:hypothetical protein